MFSRTLAGIALGGAAVVCSNRFADSSARVNHAVVILGPLPSQTDSGCRGTVYFSQAAGSKTKVVVRVIGLKPGPHGFHVHALGDLTKGCASAGGHFNPHNSAYLFMRSLSTIELQMKSAFLCRPSWRAN